MQEETQRVDPFKYSPGTGVFGRMNDVLSGLTGKLNNLYQVGSISIDTQSIALVGKPKKSVDPVIVSSSGAKKFDPYPWSNRSKWSTTNLQPAINKLNNATSIQSSLFGETWSSLFLRSIDESDLLVQALSSAVITKTFSSHEYSQKLLQVAKLINSTLIRRVDRDVFNVNMGGWDHHSDLKLKQANNFAYLNDALDTFKRELKIQGKWNNIVVVVVSDFARTLTPNSSDGSDHAWGGNYFMMGGKVKGGRILGNYPDDLDGALNIDGPDGRGRLIPTTSWDAIWNGVVQWMGVENEALMDQILPNRHNCGSNLFNKSDLFQEGGIATSLRRYLRNDKL